LASLANKTLNEAKAPMAYMIKIKRCYESPSLTDGARFLVDGLWPRGVRKEAIRLTGWEREVAPSQKLRNWFGHDPKRWGKFRKRYFFELSAKRKPWMPILKAAAKGNVTLLFSAHDLEHNNAVALQEFLQRRLRKRHGLRGPIPTNRMKRERKTQK
jgi:uncharacterized protein YeaO (DUF488 family)